VNGQIVNIYLLGHRRGAMSPGLASLKCFGAWVVALELIVAASCCGWSSCSRPRECERGEMNGRVIFLVGLIGSGLMACTSPEASRTRGGGLGADVGNRGHVVQMHEGSRPFHKTPRLRARASAPDLGPADQADRLSRR
jgi:hypothetical protein